MDRRGRILAYGGAVGLVILGAILGWVIPGLTGDIARLSLITVGFGAVLLIVFYEIGLSEDKARAREEEEERERRQPEHGDAERRSSWTGRPRRPS